MKIAIVASNFYPKVTKKLILGAVKKLKKRVYSVSKTFLVPGSFEIPIIISRNIKKYDGIIALGCIIKGQTPHFRFISSAIIHSIINLSLKNNIPIGNGILTCNNMDQAIRRAEPQKKDKGGEAADAVISVLSH